MITFVEYVNNKSIEKKKLDKIGPYTIFIVNASKIRDISQSDDEFNQSATNLEFPKLVPDNEIWVSKDISERERVFLIHNGIHQYEGKKKGKDWYDYALKKEKAEREKVDGIKFNKHKKPPSKVYYKEYCEIHSKDDNVKVWLVNGEIIRDVYKTDFMEGGNGGKGAYPWIPSQEIWIEKNLSTQEMNITTLHEYVENSCMKYKNFSYTKAHNIASKVDWHHRDKWNIDDVKALNREKALKMAKEFE